MSRFYQFSKLTCQYPFDAYKDQKTICDTIQIPQKIAFAISNIEIDKALEPIVTVLSALEKKLEENWWNEGVPLLQSVKKTVPTALLILVLIILTPMAIKGVLYFFIAPLASRRTSNCLIPDTSGSIDEIGDLDATQDIRIDISNDAKQINVASTDELLIYPQYITMAPDGGRKDTRLLLNYKFALSSLASGMFALTRFRPDSESAYVVTAMNNPTSKIAVIVIPSGSALVLHPRCLIGIVQHKDLPVTITRHWRLTSLHAWLTLQLRYLVFHGPVKLIVEGSSGVSIGQAGQNLSINQAATIGFSANLVYATTRSPTFTAYLMGKQELFNDYFPSGTGYFIYEEKPLFGKRTGIMFGRGPEGIVDSFLKLFGI
jgi:hypothetical protein